MIAGAVAEASLQDDEGYSAEEARRRLGNLGRTKFHEMMKRGEIRVTKIGAKVIVPRSEIVRILSGGDAR